MYARLRFDPVKEAMELATPSMLAKAAPIDALPPLPACDRPTKACLTQQYFSMSDQRPEGFHDFDISKYAALEDFGPEKWALLIKSRLTLSSLLDIAKGNYANTESNYAQKELFRKLLDKSDDAVLESLYTNIAETSQEGRDTTSKQFSKDLFDVLIERFFDNPLTPLVMADLNSFPSAGEISHAVRPLESRDIINLHRVVQEVGEKCAERLSKTERNSLQANWEGGSYDSPIDEVMKSSIYYRIRHMANVAIDLRRSDHAIRDDFNKLLATYRKGSDFKPPPITPVTLKRWCDNLVLPYADLILWSKWSKARLKAKDYESLLFPNKIANDVLKGTKNAYKEAFSPATVDALLQSIPKDH